MPKKARKPQDDSSRITRRDVIIGLIAAVVLAAVGVSVSMFVFGDLSSGGKSNLVDLPTPAGPEPAERSAAADLLADKSYADMTPEERDLLKGEVTRAFANAQFRASSAYVPAIDIFRLDDRTRVSRQFKAGTSPGGEAVLVETLTFYCDSPDGNISSYQYVRSPLGATSKAAGLRKWGSPFEGTIYGLDWTQATDLGFRTIEGHRVHGFEMPFNSPYSERTTLSRTWFDVESARMILREQPDTGGDEATYKFDWRQPAPVVIPPDQPVAPCASAFYSGAPSARPPDMPTAAAETATPAP